MRFDVNRLSRLAGIPGGSEPLNEAANRSHHDGDVEPAETDHRYGQGQLAEKSDKEEEDDASEGKKRAARRDMDGDGDLDEDVVLEIDDEEIKKEVLKLRKERLNEDRLRKAIRHEIQDIFASLRNTSRSGADSSWMYGDDQPVNSSQGRVVAPGRAFPGFGFKK